MHQLEQWIMETPPCTRYWTAATLAISLLVHSKILSPFQLFYSYRAVFHKKQFWRLFTTFCYFGSFNLDLLFHVYFMQRYARLLEESSGRSPARFSWMLLFISVSILCIAPLFSIAFLSQTLSSTLVYIWSRKNPDTTLSFLGLFVFKAPYLPWVMMIIHLVMHGTVPKDEITGVVVGHVWYFFNDVYPSLYNNHRPLDPPGWWLWLFERRPQVTHVPVEAVAGDNANADAGAPAQPVEVQHM
ncbi:DER1-domain-containing protein [Rhizodiscina lignyota]|uniref:Derlin n=1 Tax=Rhizodiscina lignyota TaxID=1504668 RepID=A0A9P4I5T3_9PEZI|nr:DER1-domain-containing protein [Rhizodiscina lignyota]